MLTRLLIVAVLAISCSGLARGETHRLGSERAANATASEIASVNPAHQALAENFSTLIRQAIPPVYDKQKDWGETKGITVGLRTEGKGFKTKLRRRKKEVNHGVWKHYKIKLVDPDKNLRVKVVRLRSLEAGRVGFTLQVAASLDAWARAKVYNYGVHLIALEIVGDLKVKMELDCKLGFTASGDTKKPGFSLDPQVSDARLQLVELNLRRVSNAKGPVVHELGDALRRHVERELTGPKLTQKLNRAIDKKRDRLTIETGNLWESSWWPSPDSSEAEKE
ncbi:hypothetical protein [Adhaeretor mobilis]|uniref:Uncharacterized protein n=1 Tax=Adhaeretor mobilis TaxID=1930276 RepID=A0A517MQI8_9BACT|nr:hypothetical protein [Adhaeretor mobilis]QDS97141.1 hypothetical protein HG15A2_04010 [Adhaeretor mobilis]